MRLADVTGAPWRVRVPVAAGAFLLGTVGVAVAGGMAIPHASKLGWSGRDVAGVVLGILGVLLVVAAVVVALRGTRWWQKLLAVPVVVYALYSVTWPVTTGVYATHSPVKPLSGRTPADVGLDYEDVRFTTADGVELAAWHVPSRNGATVVVRHGASSNRSNVLDHVRVLAEGGYGVLATDARGHGTSAGDAMELGWHAVDDVRAAVDFLTDEVGVARGRIAVLGLSMGGEEAITAAAEDERIAAVVAEGATIRTTRDFLEIDKGVAMWLSAPHYWTAFTTADLLSDASPPPALRDAMADVAPRPVLLIAAGDVPDEETFGRVYQRAAPEHTDLWVVDGSGHTDGLRTAPDAWRDRVLTFLEASLDLA